jgi:hypothetical protein
MGGLSANTQCLPTDFNKANFCGLQVARDLSIFFNVASRIRYQRGRAAPEFYAAIDIGSDLSSASVSPVVCSIFELLSYWINEMKDLGLLRRCRPPDSRFSAAGSASDLLVIGRA